MTSTRASMVEGEESEPDAPRHVEEAKHRSYESRRASEEGSCSSSRERKCEIETMTGVWALEPS
jgi:hypothetical protein